MNPLLADVADFQRQTRRPITQQEINAAVRSLHGRPDPPPPYQSLVYSRPTQNVAQDNALYGVGPSISSHTPSWAETAGNAIYGAARWAGLDSQADRMRNEAVNLPIVGDAITGLEAAHDFAQGDILSGVGNVSLAAIGLVPGAGDAAAAGLRQGVRQIYRVVPQAVEASRAFQPAAGRGVYAFTDQASAESFRRATGGRTYSAQIDSFEPEYLDDFSIEMHPPGTASVAANAGDSELYPRGQQLYIRDTNLIDPGTIRAIDAERQGIPGISFLDAGSRSVGEGTHNFVIFDDSIIDIINKY